MRATLRWILPLEVLGTLPGRDQHQIVQADLRGFPQRAPYLGCERLRIDRTQRGALHFLHDNQCLALRRVHAEGRPAIAAQAGGDRLDERFDILGIMVSAVQDDEFLAASGHDQLAVVHDAEITGAQPCAALTRNDGAEDLARGGVIGPVAGGDAAALHPYFPDTIARASLAGIGVDDGDFLVAADMAGAGQREAAIIGGLLLQAASFQRLRIEVQRAIPGILRAGHADDQRGFPPGRRRGAARGATVRRRKRRG